MKATLPLLLLALTLTELRSENIKTTTGREYEGATISRAEPDGVVIMYSAGIVKIPFTELPPEWQKKYGYNAEAAAAYRAQVDQAAAQREAAVAAAKEKQRLFNLTASTPLPEPSLPDQSRAEQQSSNIRSLSIEAHESGTVSSFDVLWQTSWGSYDRDNHQAKKLLVSVHDLSRKFPKVDVEILFLGVKQPSGNLVIYKRAEIPVEMKGLIEITGYVQSPIIKSNEQIYAALGERYASGIKMFGWIVRGKASGQVFQVCASNQTLLEIAQSNPRQSYKLDNLIAQYGQLSTE
jgi:hypothetical protein